VIPRIMVTRSLAVERSHLLCVGALARIEIDSDSEGSLDIEGTITAVEGERLTVRFRQLSVPLSPLLGQDRTAMLKVWDRFGVHRAEVPIHGVVEEGGNAAVIVGAPTHFVGTQTRRFARVSARLELSLARPRADGPAPAERTLSWDISAGGLSFLSDSGLEVDDRVAVTLVLPQEVADLVGEVPALEMRVVRTETIAESGARFFGGEFQNVSRRLRERLVEVVLGLQRIMR
jgi:PilZ domain-containing protein